MDEFGDFLPERGVDWSAGGHVGTVRYGTDQQVVIFYNKSVPNVPRSKELGRPFNEDKVYVKMHPPGERLNVIDRPARIPEDARRFPMQWAQFQQNREQTPSGTSIALLYPESQAASDNLRACGVHTIEQCAELSGNAIDAIGMGAQQAVNAAKKFLEQAQKGVHYTHMRLELEQRDSEIRALNKKVEFLTEQLQKTGPVQPQAGLTQAQLFQLLQNMAGSPQMPPPGVAVTPQFDAQTAQIAATHPSVEEVKQRKRGRPRKNATEG